MTSQRPPARTPPVCAWTALSVPLLILVTMGPAAAFDVVLSTQGEYMDGYLVNGKAFPPRVIVNDPDPHPPDSLTVPPYLGGRHLNGKVCFFPSRERRHHTGEATGVASEQRLRRRPARASRVKTRRRRARPLRTARSAS